MKLSDVYPDRPVDVERNYARRRADFCLATGVSPKDYDDLTVLDIEEFSAAVEERNKRR